MPAIQIDSTSEEENQLTAHKELKGIRIPSDFPLIAIYDLINTLDGVSLNRTIFYSSDFETLLPGQWLNDKIINTYFELLSVYHPHAYYFTTFLLPMLESKPLSEVVEWFSDVDFSRYTHFFFPINRNNTHWSLAMIENNLITGFDSLLNVPESTLKRLMSFYKAAILRNRDLRLDYFMRRTHGKIPRQENSDDCGVFCCAFAKYYAITKDYMCFQPSDIPLIRRQIMHELLAGKILYMFELGQYNGDFYHSHEDESLKEKLFEGRRRQIDPFTEDEDRKTVDNTANISQPLNRNNPEKRRREMTRIVLIARKRFFS